jgi:hypothetical protein
MHLKVGRSGGEGSGEAGLPLVIEGGEPQGDDPIGAPPPPAHPPPSFQSPIDDDIYPLTAPLPIVCPASCRAT